MGIDVRSAWEDFEKEDSGDRGGPMWKQYRDVLNREDAEMNLRASRGALSGISPAAVGALRPVTEAGVRFDRQGAGAVELVFRITKNKFRIFSKAPLEALYQT